MDPIYIVIFFALVLFFVAAIYFLKWRKGSISIRISNSSFITGEKIKGKIILDIKKHVKSNRLVVGLRCEKTGEGYFRKNRLHKEKKEILFDFNQLVDKKKEYPIGRYSYNFSIVIPLNVSQGLEGVSKTLLNLTEGIIRRKNLTKWYLYSELQCKGVNLSKRVQINIV